MPGGNWKWYGEKFLPCSFSPFPAPMVLLAGVKTVSPLIGDRRGVGCLRPEEVRLIEQRRIVEVGCSVASACSIQRGLEKVHHDQFWFSHFDSPLSQQWRPHGPLCQLRRVRRHTGKAQGKRYESVSLSFKSKTHLIWLLSSFLSSLSRYLWGGVRNKKQNRHIANRLRLLSFPVGVCSICLLSPFLFVFLNVAWIFRCDYASL